MELAEVISNNFPTLLRSLETSNVLLGKLRSVVFVKDRIHSVKQQVTMNEKNDALLSALLEVPQDLEQSVMDGFMAALRSCGQDHVANVFRRESDKFPMSDEHREMLTKPTVELCKFLDPENGLLKKLISLGVITWDDNNRIRSKYGFDDKVEELIDTLLRKSDNSFQALINSLNETGQSHVAFILTGAGDSRPLSEYYSEKLREKRANVVPSIIPRCLMSTLISKSVLTPYDQQRVDSKQTTNEKGEMILDLISRKSQAAFDGFMDTLQRCHHEHVVQELVGPEVAARIEVEVNASKDVIDVQSLEAEIREYMQRSLVNDGNGAIDETLTSNGISVSRVLDGSIIVKFRCRDYAALESLQELFGSKKLDQVFTEAFQPKFADKGLECLRVSIPEEEFQRCLELKLMTSKHREALLSSAERLADKITVNDELLDKLSLGKLLREAVKEAVSEQQVKTLLDIISRRPDSAFHLLVSALNNTQQTDAASYLRKLGGDEATQCKNVLKNEPGKNCYYFRRFLS